MLKKLGKEAFNKLEDEKEEGRRRLKRKGHKLWRHVHFPARLMLQIYSPGDRGELCRSLTIMSTPFSDEYSRNYPVNITEREHL